MRLESTESKTTFNLSAKYSETNVINQNECILPDLPLKKAAEAD